jgi:hypothetical protein
VIVQPRPAGTPAVPPQEIGGDAAFVEKHILPRIVEWLRVAPLPPRGRDVRPALFVGVYRFF